MEKGFRRSISHPRYLLVSVDQLWNGTLAWVLQVQLSFLGAVLSGLRLLSFNIWKRGVFLALCELVS